MPRLKIIISSGLWIITFFIIATCARGSVGGAVPGGFQVGGRIGPIMGPGCGCPLMPPCLHGCICGTMDVTIIPYGYSAPFICSLPGMPTLQGMPLTPGSTGMQILGLCTTIFPTAVCPMIGVSL